ncbi:DUF4255 domain-containing protein [Jiangella endophytica]|uniref:DUF4255 domain-containing protein n=1 Tax=Jiangella endophytica TaxID=1623398 RepID=UPI000E3562BB|nr:DUF4255 domain-containing protein [Jiangella endophytica]
MQIPAVDEGLERLLRATLPLPPDIGDVSFERPSGTWSAQLSRVVVNLFLYAVSRSTLPPVGGGSRLGPDGRREVRDDAPLVDLHYLVSAWAATVPEEHRLLGDVLGLALSHQAVPPEHLAAPLAAGVRLSLGKDDTHRTRELWSSLGGPHKASFTLIATVAADLPDWRPAAPPVQRVEGRTRAVSAVTETGRRG